MIAEETYHIFVFFPVVGASAVYEQTAGAQGVPHVGEYFPLALGAYAHLCRRPFGCGLGVFAEHAFARAGCVDQYHVEVVMQFSEVCCCVTGYDRVVVSPFYDVFGQDMSAVAHDFVAHDETPGGKGREGERGFSSRCGAQVEIPYRRVDKPAQNVIEEHRRGFLHIVYAAV